MNRVYTAGEAEFDASSPQEAAEKVKAGLEILASIGIRPEGFVAPAWLMPESADAVLADLGIRYTIRFHEIVLPAGGTRIPAPVLVLSSRSALRRRIARIYLPWRARRHRNADVLRVAIHPVDMEHPEMTRLAAEVISASCRDREVVTYGELIRRLDPAEAGTDHESGGTPSSATSPSESRT